MENPVKLCQRCNKRPAMPGDAWCCHCDEMQYEANVEMAQEREREREQRGREVD